MLTYNDLTSKTVDKIVPRIVDSVFKNSPVLTRLKNKRRFQFEGGLTIRHNIMYAPLKGGSYHAGKRSIPRLSRLTRRSTSTSSSITST